MTTREFGGTGVRVPVIGQGTWQMEQAPAEAVCALRAGLDLGMTHVDTAEMYGDGRVEDLVARAIEGRRDEVFLATKVLPDHASRAGTLRACENSLRRMRTDRIDLYLLHWPSERHPIGETMRAMEELVDAGKVRFFGVSNFDARELREAQATCARHRVACNQVLYHLGDRGTEREMIPYCEASGVAVVGYSPFGERTFRAGGALGEVARKHGRSPRQVALAFLVRRPSLFAIPKAARVDHVRENAGGDFALDAHDVAAIEDGFPLQ